jgi:hypothetical protein
LPPGSSSLALCRATSKPNVEGRFEMEGNAEGRTEQFEAKQFKTSYDSGLLI